MDRWFVQSRAWQFPDGLACRVNDIFSVALSLSLLCFCLSCCWFDSKALPADVESRPDVSLQHPTEINEAADVVALTNCAYLPEEEKKKL